MIYGFTALGLLLLGYVVCAVAMRDRYFFSAEQGQNVQIWIFLLLFVILIFAVGG